MNILEDLFYGRINLNEQCFAQKSGYARHANALADSEEKLMAHLNTLPGAEAGHAMLAELVSAQWELSRFMELDRFMEGYRLGAGTMLDTFVLPQKSVVRDMNG